MTKRRLAGEQIIAILREREQGMATADLSHRHGISRATFFTWKARVGGMDVSDAHLLKVLEDEDAKLKTLPAEAMLGVAMFEDLNGRTF